MDYTEASKILGDRSSRKIGNNTYLQRRDSETVAIKLHATDVLTFRPNTVTYSTGGWRTVTTKQRLNEYGPGRVYSDRGEWLFHFNGKEYPFADGITISAGTVKGAGDLSETRKRKAEKAAIKRYIADYLSELEAGNVPAPSAGDCWFCSMFPDSGPDDKNGHLRAHIEEKYYVPSLAVRALKTMGAGDAYFWYLGQFWGGEKSAFCQGLRPTVERMMRRYLFRNLGHAA